MQRLFYNKVLLIFLCIFFFISCKKNVSDVTPIPPPTPTPVEDDTTNLKNYTKDLTIVNWNIEWFGDGSMFNGNLDVQEANAGKILKYLNADLYGICEVVDTTRFGRMIRNTLGNEYRYVVSSYPSLLEAQKLAFIYNRNIFRNVKTRAFMGLSSTAYGNFASGRFPFLLTADVVINGQRNPVNYILLHAKANADLTSYTKRLNASIEMKDSLDNYFRPKYFLIMGDYNDNFNGSILSGYKSPYKNFIDDNTNYNAISLPLNTTGYQSTISYSNSVIDQQIISANMGKWYVLSSASIRTDVSNPVPDFTSHSTSDHYPLSSVYHIY
jgi:hypothetical protein